MRIQRLAELGFELRRPETDYLSDGIYELRIGWNGKNYRILYTFTDKQVVLLTHGIEKERRVPPAEIDLAVACKKKWENDPVAHTYETEV